MAALIRPRGLAAMVLLSGVAGGIATGAAPALAAGPALPALPALGDVDARLANYELEATQLGADLPRPDQRSGQAGRRKLVDAEVAYALGDYDTAAVMLFDLAGRPGADQEAATFYLAEALFQKSDRSAARGYYEQVVGSGNVSSKYYQPALVRLIEIAIASRDDASITAQVAALDRISPGLRLASVPYVRGKLAYAQGKYDEAIAYFQDVARGSDYEMQASYYAATSYVAKQDLQRATGIFTELAARKPRTANDRRIVELSQLALGRLYYERDQPSKSIDSYLMVDRHSDLFSDALYEVGWVYVKSKQYDKALRALELLSLADPQSTKGPTVRILEGNLRIRKAQMIRTAQVGGTLDGKAPDDPQSEYDRAVQLFSETHGAYLPSYAALAQIVDSTADPAQYLSQIAGRSVHVFQAVAPIPEAAIQYLRDEPGIRRVVSVESDLGDVTSDLAETEATIARLEGVLAAKDRAAVYPALASRRTRLGAIQGEVLAIRNALAEQQLRLVDGSAGLAALSATRRQRFAAMGELPDPAQIAADRQAQRLAQCDAIERSLAEIEAAIGQTQAVSVALRNDAGAAPGAAGASDHKAMNRSLDEISRDAQAIENELDGLRRELQISRDLAGVGDTAAAAMRNARNQLLAAEDAEGQALAGLAGSSRDRSAAQRLVAQATRAAQLSQQLVQADREIDALVDEGLQSVRGALVEAKATLATYRAELAGYEGETRAVGGVLLATGFKDARAKLYDIVIRSDVGTVDVAWSQKADTDDDLKRLNLSRQRELKQLRDEFKDILDSGTVKPSAPSRKLELPLPEPNQPGDSPDKPSDKPSDTSAELGAGSGKAASKPAAAKSGGSSRSAPPQNTAKPAPAKRPSASTSTPQGGRP
jgi:hypothetical protein